LALSDERESIFDTASVQAKTSHVVASVSHSKLCAYARVTQVIITHVFAFPAETAAFFDVTLGLFSLSSVFNGLLKAAINAFILSHRNRDDLMSVASAIHNNGTINNHVLLSKCNELKSININGNMSPLSPSASNFSQRMLV
jgi:hypothetical protein